MSDLTGLALVLNVTLENDSDEKVELQITQMVIVDKKGIEWPVIFWESSDERALSDPEAGKPGYKLVFDNVETTEWLFQKSKKTTNDIFKQIDAGSSMNWNVVFGSSYDNYEELPDSFKVFFRCRKGELIFNGKLVFDKITW